MCQWSPDRKLIWLQSVSQLCQRKHSLVLTVSCNKGFLVKGTVLHYITLHFKYASHLTADWHLKQHCSGDIKVMFRSVGRTTFQCLYWSLGEGILSERERGICRGLPSFFGHWGCSLCHSNLYIFPFIMQFYLKRDYNTLKEVFHINTVITYRPKTYILFSFGKLPSS